MSTIGIDIGTSSVKCAIIDDIGDVIDDKSSGHQANISNLPSGHNEQNVWTIVSCLENCLALLEPNKLSAVVKVAISCQMHGILFWSKLAEKENLRLNQCKITDLKSIMITSNLVTWQDARCSETFLQEIRDGEKLHSGFGLATYAWLKCNRVNLDQFSYCGTIGDFVVHLLTGACGSVYMTSQNANSWGVYDVGHRRFNTEWLGRRSICEDILPDIVEPGYVVGNLVLQFGCCQNAEIYAAFGDFQSSVYGYLAVDSHVLIIGTSAQLCRAVTSSSIKSSELTSPIDVWPFFGENRFVTVSASLNGGNVLQEFVNLLQKWTFEISGVSISANSIWEKIIPKLQQVTSNELVISPLLFGERYLGTISQGMTLKGLTQEHFEIEIIFDSLIKGLLRNIHDMYISYHDPSTTSLHLVGMAKEPWMLRYIKAEFGDSYKSIEVIDNHTAAVGAAKFVSAL